MPDVAENGEQEQGRQGGASQLDDDVAGHAVPGEIAAHRERERHRRVQVGARDGAHEEDDRHHHEPGGDDRGSEADLPLRVEKAATRRDEDEQEGAEQLGEQPPPFELRVVPFLAGAELEGQPVSNALLRFADGIGAAGRRVTNRVDDAGTIPRCRTAPKRRSHKIGALRWARE